MSVDLFAGAFAYGVRGSRIMPEAIQSQYKRVLSSPLFIAGFALALRLVLLYVASHTGPRPVRTDLPFGMELGRVARAIAAGEGFSSPLVTVDSGPTAWFTPIYPYLIAGIFKVWGIYGLKSHTAIQIMNCIFAALTTLPMYGIARKIFGRGVAVGASWTWVFLPTALYYPMLWVWDTALMALVCSLIVWVTLGMREKRDVPSWAGYGALWAVGVLINPSILSLLPFFLGWIVWDVRKAPSCWAKPVAAALLVFAIGMVPWTVRNYLVFGKFIMLRSNFGLELWLGNNPNATDSSGQWQHPSENREEAEKYTRMGELAYMGEKEREALAFIRTQPRDALNFTFRRFEANWLAFSESPVDLWNHGTLYVRFFLLLNCLLSLLCLLGVLYASRARRPESTLLAMVLLLYPLVFYVTHTSLRLRFPIDPIIVILAANAVAHLISLAGSRNKDTKKTPARVSSLPAT